MTKEELAKLLNGREYGHEITENEKQLAKDNSLVVVFGFSDDCIELRGAVDDEVYGFALIDSKGILPSRSSLFDIDSDDDSNDDEILDFLLRKNKAVKLKGTYSSIWEFTFPKEHFVFEIYEDDELYCKGIVFSLNGLDN